ncbi:hypothetical protein CC2G_013231 [Coprinopsis cinerea AmutBmut pab1-1]|nr:hypothetical protein CC2G_013231 [Coprinopsis cinerea AmutBmut pab1-1]
MSAPRYNYFAPAMPVPPLNEEESLFMVTNAQYAVRLKNRLLETPGAEPVARIISIGHMIALIIAQLMGIVNTLHQFVFGIHEHLVHRPEITDLVLELRNPQPEAPGPQLYHHVPQHSPPPPMPIPDDIPSPIMQQPPQPRMPTPGPSSTIIYRTTLRDTSFDPNDLPPLQYPPTPTPPSVPPKEIIDVDDPTQPWNQPLGSKLNPIWVRDFISRLRQIGIPTCNLCRKTGHLASRCKGKGKLQE